jgi:hypothetical protein
MNRNSFVSSPTTTINAQSLPYPSAAINDGNLSTDLDKLYPVSPFDIVALKHIQRTLQSFEKIYGELVLKHTARISRAKADHAAHLGAHNRYTNEAIEEQTTLSAIHEMRIAEMQSQFHSYIQTLYQRVDNYLSDSLQPDQLLQNIQVHVSCAVEQTGQMLPMTVSLLLENTII